MNIIKKDFKDLSDKEKQDFTEKTITLSKEIDMVRAVTGGMSETHLKDTYAAIREQYELTATMDMTIKANKDTADLLGKQCYSLLKIIELKKALAETEALSNELKSVNKLQVLKLGSKFVKPN